MTNFLRYRFSILGGVALAAGAFVLGTVSAAPLSRVELSRVAFEVSIPQTLLVIFILVCVSIALHQCRPR